MVYRETVEKLSSLHNNANDLLNSWFNKRDVIKDQDVSVFKDMYLKCIDLNEGLDETIFALQISPLFIQNTIPGPEQHIPVPLIRTFRAIDHVEKETMGKVASSAFVAFTAEVNKIEEKGSTYVVEKHITSEKDDNTKHTDLEGKFLKKVTEYDFLEKEAVLVKSFYIIVSLLRNMITHTLLLISVIGDGRELIHSQEEIQRRRVNPLTR